MIEARKSINHFKIRAIQILSIALRTPLFMMLGCGLVPGRGVVNDFYDGKKTVTYHDGYSPVPYNEKLHGKITDWLEPGQEITALKTLTDDNHKMIHDHAGSNLFGLHLFRVVEK